MHTVPSCAQLYHKMLMIPQEAVAFPGIDFCIVVVHSILVTTPFIMTPEAQGLHTTEPPQTRHCIPIGRASLSSEIERCLPNGQLSNEPFLQPYIPDLGGLMQSATSMIAEACEAGRIPDIASQRIATHRYSVALASSGSWDPSIVGKYDQLHQDIYLRGGSVPTAIHELMHHASGQNYSLVRRDRVGQIKVDRLKVNKCGLVVGDLGHNIDEAVTECLTLAVTGRKYAGTAYDEGVDAVRMLVDMSEGELLMDDFYNAYFQQKPYSPSKNLTRILLGKIDKTYGTNSLFRKIDRALDPRYQWRGRCMVREIIINAASNRDKMT